MSTYIENQDQEKKFLENLDVIIKKYGIPEQLYIDTGKNIIISSPASFRVLPAPQNAVCKQI